MLADIGEEYGLAILTLEEALQTFKYESQIYRLQFKTDSN